MNDDGNKRKLYNALSKDYDMGSYEQFSQDVEDEGKRRKLYDAIKGDYDLPDFNGFSRQLAGERRQAPAPAQSPAPTTQRQQQPQRRQQRSKAGRQQRPWRPSPAQMAGFSATIAGVRNTVAQGRERMKNLSAYTKQRMKHPLDAGVPASGLGAGKKNKPTMLSSKNVVAGDIEYNPETGKMEQTYLTQAGNKHTSRFSADMEQRRIDEEKERRLHPVESKLRAAEAEKERLAGLMRKRMEEIDARKTGHPVAGLIRDLADESHGMPGGLVSDNGMRDYRSDRRYRQLEAAARKNHQTIKTLRDKSNGQMNEFWHTLGNIVTNGYTFSDGQIEAYDALSFMEAQQLIPNINRKIEKGGALTKEEESAEAVLRDFATDEMVQDMYGKDYGPFARAATAVGTSLGFMKDIMLTGGGAGALTKGIYKGVVKGGMKLLARKGVETGLKAAIGKGLLKATGVALGTTAAGAMITNTTSLNRTLGEAGRLMAGHVGVNENGGYTIDGQKGMLEAIAEAERDIIGEYQSEMFGEFIPGGGKLVRKGLEKIGLSRVSNALTSIGNKEWYRRYSKLLKAGGWNGLPGEGIEEYEGFLFDALTGHGSEALEQVQDPRTHIDIWLGCATMGALLGSVPAVAQAGSTAQYYRYKHKVNKSGASAASIIGDRWNEMQEQIDGTPNGGMADVLMQMVLDPNLNHEQKNAVLDYARNLTKMRGCNLAAANNAGEEKDPDAEAANNAYGEGYNATEDTDMQDVKNRMEVLSESVGEFLGEDVMRDLEASPVDTLRTIRGFASLSDGQKQMAVDYVNAKSAYDGLIQRVRDDIDSEIAQSDAMVDSRVAREEQGGDGMIHPATLKEQDADGHDKQVFVVSGNVRMMDDGSMIDTGNSDETIIVRDAETGKLQFMSPGGLLSLGDVIDAEQLKEETRQQIRERKAREAADKTDGTLAFAAGDTYQFPDEAGGQHTYAIMQDLGDGMVAVALDGNQQMPVSMSKQELQAMADARNRSRVTNLISRQGQQTQAEVHNSRQPQYNLNEEITLQAGSEDVRAIVTSEENEDGLIEVESDQPINGRKVNMFSREQLDGMLSVPQIDGERAVLDGVSNVGDGLRDAMSGQSAAADEQAGAEPMPMIDVKGRMKPDWSKATPQRAHAYLYNERGLSRENADAFVENNRKSAESELAKLRKKRPKMGTDLDEFEEKTAGWQGKMDDLQRQHDYWKAVRHEQFKTDSAEQARISEKHARRMEEAKRRRAEEERLREEAERKEREAINGVPDMVDDTPQDARARGYRRLNGYKVDRQEPLQALQGKAVSVKFSNDVIPQGNVAVIDARQLQPSHAGGQRNPLHFIDEAQPKERIDDASRYASSKIAGNIRPEEITSSVTAYTGAPTINARGEVIQGNNRSDALRQMWQSYPEEAARYKQYLIGHAADFGLRAEDIEAMQSPVLVNMLDVEDAEAITLGQFVAQDTESGGTERIKAKNAVQKMGNDMRTFANLLLKSADEEATFAQLLDDNGTDVLKWMSQKGYITPTQYKSAFDGRGNVSGEAKNDLRSIMYQSVFRDGGTRLEEMFNAMPVKAQKAILATAYRDYDSPIAERMVVEIQNSIRAFNAMSQDEAFKKATNFKDAREAAEMWKRSYQFDDATGESYLPSENFSNFALLLATLYKGANQTTIQGTFNKLYDLIQGTQEASLFEQPDNTPRTLAQAIEETLNIEYNGQRRSNVLAGDSPAIQGGQQGSNGNAETGERAAPGEEPADGGGGTGSNSEEVNTPQIAPSGQLKTAGLRDVTNPDNAGIGTNAAKTKAQDKGGGVDRQGNPLNSDGTLYIEEVASIDDITDADFEEPTRTIALPDIPNNVRDAIGAGEKPVIIKKNIFERNGISHSDLTPEQSRDILRSALYNADLYGQNQKNTKPYNWVVINITDEAGKNKLVLLEVNQNNNNVEIVHWHYLDARGLEKLRRQADREDGQLLILPSIKEEVGALSDPTDELSSADKGSEISATEQEKTEEVAENEPTDARKAAVGGEGEAEQRLADSGRDAEQDKGLSEDEADDLILLSAERAIPIPEMELTHENWVNEFGNGVLITPLGEIKLGENQFSKMIDKGREKEAGMIKPTLTDPDFVIEEASMATEGETERPASHLYVKSFIGIDGRKRYFFKSVTVKKDGMEVNVSNHFDRVKRLREALKNGKLLYRFDGGAQTEQSPATASVTTSRVEPGTSEGKVSENSATGQGKAGKSVENNGVEPFSSKMESASADVNTSPTDAQKEAGNYRKGHLKFDGYDISIENPKGSVRRGTDADGNEWEQEMQNTYGYIRGTEGVDGDHIDVFLSDDPTSGDVFVVDQVNKDGSFDEHKVMYGFPDIESARKAYLSNYEEGWQGLGAITPVSKEEFKKWIESSHRKTKPFAEYSGVKPLGDTLFGEKVVAEPRESAQAYTIEPAEYTNKKGKTEHQVDMARSYQLSDEVDGNGRRFVLNSEGSVEFGEIGTDTGLTPAPILLSEGIITTPGTNDGYGLVHIEARHGEQIRNAGYNSVVEFIEEVARNYEVIREGKKRYGNHTYMLQLTDKHNNTLMVELSGDGAYWNVNTAGIFKTSYGAKRDVVYNRHTTAKQSAETAEASLSGEQSGTTPSTRMKAPTQTSVDVSVGKDNTLEGDLQGKAGKSVENSIEKMPASLSKAIDDFAQAGKHRTEGDEDNDADGWPAYKKAKRRLLTVLDGMGLDVLHRLQADSGAGLAVQDVLRRYLKEREAQERLSRSFHIHLNAQNENRPILAVESKERAVRPYDFVEVGKDARLSLSGTYHDGGYVIGMDGHVLFARKENYPQSVEGKVTDGKGNIVDDKYPDWKKLFNDDFIPAGVEARQLRLFANGVESYAKEEGMNRKDVSRLMVSFMDAGNKVRIYSLRNLQKFLRAAKDIGSSELLETDNGVLCAKSENGSALCTPLFMDDFNDYVFAYSPVTVDASVKFDERPGSGMVAEQIAGQISVMPSNVVPPHVREALEERGVRFVQTDNKGRIQEDSPHAGKTWASVYGKKRKRGSLQREGSDSTTSQQVSNPADGRSRAAFARRQWRRAHDLANDWIEKLGIGEITSVYERIGDVPGNGRFSKRKRMSKGWYAPETGRIVIVMNNHHSPQDVLQTILHEAVAHYGLRKLFGKNFDNFLDNVYDGADILIKERIAAKQAVLVSKGKNAKRTAAEWRRVATEEYLAGLAETTDFENAVRHPWAMHWFNRIKSWFLDMLHSIGLKNFGGQSLYDTVSDNELRYILWRSYKNMAEPGRYRNVFQEAEDIAMQNSLGAGNYAKANAVSQQEAEPRPAKVAERNIGSTSPGMVRERGFEDDVRFVEDYENDVESINGTFNEQLQQQINGTLPKGHIYDLGMPSDILLSTGFPNVPIELSATHLSDKASVAHHPFGIDEMKDLVKAIQKPMAVFAYGDKSQSQNAIVEIQHDGKNFVVGIHFNQQRHGAVINDIRGLYPKDNAEWLNWVTQDKLLYADKEKVQTLIDQQRRTLAEVGYLDLNSVAKIIKDFVNPIIVSQENENNPFRDDDFSVRDKAIVRDAYERMVTTGGYQFQEAVQDAPRANVVRESGVEDDVRFVGEGTGDRIMELFNQAIDGKLKGKPVAIGRITKEGKEYLENLSGVKMKDVVDFVLNPSDMVHIYNDHFGDNEKDKGNNVPLTEDDIRNIAEIISHPDSILFGTEAKTGRNMFFFFKKNSDGTYNLAEVYGDRKGNLTAKSFYNTKKEASQRVMEIKRSLLPTSVTYSGATPSSGAKIPTFFETTSVDGEEIAEPIKSDAFKQFFGDWENAPEEASKMVDETGKPKVFYHNTPNEFTVFDATRNGTHNDAGWLGDGFYFYGVEHEGDGYGKNKMAVYLNIRNPYYATSEDMERLAEANSREASIAFRQQLEEAGYDGVYYNGDLREEAVAFYPNQIKSAPDNVGTYDAGNDDIRYRDSDDATPRALSRDAYERLVLKGTEQFAEAVQDSMRSLKNLYLSIIKAEGTKGHIEDVAGYENAYLAENRMHSMSQGQIDAWEHDFMQPLVKIVNKITGGDKAAYSELIDYMMAKHGLERNQVLAERDFKKYQQEYPQGTKTIDDFREKDYSGLTALTGEDDVQVAEDIARQMASDFEREHDLEITELWDRVNAATKSSLEKAYMSGIMSRERYEQIRDMFEYYIPLQGFDEAVAEDVYAYVGSDGTRMYGTPIRTAKGRKSKADDPLATIEMNGEAAIRQGNRNIMKQRFLNFVQNHPSDLVSVSDVWLRHNDVTDEWEQYFDADLKEDDTPDEVERKTREFEERMEQLAESDPGHYKRGGDLPGVPYRVLDRNNAKQHQVLVRRNGNTFVLTINGNPRAAQALNGLTNPDVFTEGFFW